MQNFDRGEEPSRAVCVNELATSCERLTVSTSNDKASCLSKDENTDFSRSCEKSIDEQLGEEDSISNIDGQLQHKKTDNMCSPVEIPVPAYINSRPSRSNDNDEDEHSVSSLESLEDFPCPSSVDRQSKRIFADYWNHAIEEEGSQLKQKPSSINITRTAPYSLSSCSPQAITSLQDEFAYQEFKRDIPNYSSNSTTDGYEEILKVNEIGRTTMPSSTSLKECNTENRDVAQRSEAKNKRSIFKNKYSESVPSLVSYGYRSSTNMPVRKTSSTSSLRKKQRSCLRSRSLSVDSTALASLQSSSSRLSVSFDSRVFVHEYEKPLQRYTANGWSKWFA